MTRLARLRLGYLLGAMAVIGAVVMFDGSGAGLIAAFPFALVVAYCGRRWSQSRKRLVADWPDSPEAS